MIYLIKWWFSIATFNYQRVYPQIGKMIMRNWNCGCSMFDKLLVRNSPYSPYSNFFPHSMPDWFKNAEPWYAHTPWYEILCEWLLWSPFLHALKMLKAWYLQTACGIWWCTDMCCLRVSISMVNETIVICVGPCGVRSRTGFWWCLHGNSTLAAQAQFPWQSPAWNAALLLPRTFSLLLHLVPRWRGQKKIQGRGDSLRSSALGGSSSADRKWWLSLVPDSWALIHA